MNHKRSFMILGLLLITLMVLAACSQPAAPAPSEPETTAPEASEPAEDEVVTITFWDNQQTESGLSEFQQIAVDEFEAANPNIKVEVVTVPYTEYQQKLLLAVQSDDPPDVSTVDQIWNSGFAVAGAIEPLDSYVAASDSIAQENFFPGAWESATWDGGVWGVPFNVDVWQFTFYNADMLSAAGVDPESLATWEGLQAAGEALTTDGQYGVGLFSQMGEDTVVVMNSFIYSNDGSVLNEDGSCALTDPEAVEALEYLLGLQAYAPEGILNASSGDMRELFLNGTLATEWWPALEQPTLQGSDLNWDFVNGTAPEGKTPVGTYGGWNLVMYKDSPNQEAVWKFIEFMTDPEVNGRVVDLIPANKVAAQNFLEANRKGPDRIMEHLDNARPRPLSPNYLQVATIEQEMMQAIFSGTPVADATAAACDEINALGVGEVAMELAKEEEPAGEPIKLVFWDNQQTESGLSQFQQIAVDEFEAANPNIEVEVVTVPYTEYQQKLLLAVQSGNPPDVSTVDQIWNSGFAVANAIIPLDDFVADSDSIVQENFFPGAWDSATWDGQVWGIPFNVDVWQFTFYNADMLSAAGVDPESLATWEGLQAAGEALTTDGQYGVGLFSQMGEDTVVVMNSFIYSNGGSVLNGDGSCALGDPEAIEALEYLLGLQAYAPEGILNASSGDMRELFLNGTLATEWWPALEQPTLQGSDLNWEFVNGTAPEGKTPVGTYGGWNLVVYANSPNQEAAWKFIEFMTDPEVNGRVVDLIPANKVAAQNFLEANRKGPDRIMEHLDNARPRPLSPNYLQVATIEQEMMQAIFSGTPVQDAVDLACAEIDGLK
ncbi:MAG: sugar ABC transporter substrate-binding protein [Chloroflexota bacterium]|nr:sugar ABC transporter substrate-binding protein [Chloroflexota bacterium]